MDEVLELVAPPDPRVQEQGVLADVPQEVVLCNQWPAEDVPPNGVQGEPLQVFEEPVDVVLELLDFPLSQLNIGLLDQFAEAR